MRRMWTFLVLASCVRTNEAGLTGGVASFPDGPPSWLDPVP